jgi:hypothetical protein
MGLWVRIQRIARNSIQDWLSDPRAILIHDEFAPPKGPALLATERNREE